MKQISSIKKSPEVPEKILRCYVSTSRKTTASALVQ